jgi:hypothetical protein
MLRRVTGSALTWGVPSVTRVCTLQSSNGQAHRTELLYEALPHAYQPHVSISTLAKDQPEQTQPQLADAPTTVQHQQQIRKV